MTKKRVETGWMSTSSVIAAHASAGTEIDIRGWIPTKLILATSALSPVANIGFKGRPSGYSTSRIVWDTDNNQPLQVVIKSTGHVYPLPTNPGLAGLSYITPYSKTSGLSSTAAWNQTRAATIYIEGMG